MGKVLLGWVGMVNVPLGQVPGREEPRCDRGCDQGASTRKYSASGLNPRYTKIFVDNCREAHYIRCELSAIAEWRPYAKEQR